MGGVVSAIFQDTGEIWTAEERAQNEASLRLQRSAADFCVKYLYVDVPAKVNKMGIDPASPLWIQIDQDKILELQATAEGSAVFGGTSPNSKATRYQAVDERLFASVPTGVMVDKSGGIQIIFEKESVGKLTYNLSVRDAQMAEMSVGPLKRPQPPTVVDVDKRSLKLNWDYPAPPGVVQASEILHAVIPPADRESYAIDGEIAVPLTWKVLCKKKWEFLHFQDETLENLKPGTTHVFRMRYRNIKDWSDYSDVTDPVTTLPDVPDTPKQPMCLGAFPDAVSMQWRMPHHNGADIISYVLRGRSVGDDFVEVYRGTSRSHLVVGLHPDFAYSFHLIAVNEVGESAPSPLLSVKLPPRKSDRGRITLDEELARVANNTKNAWREFWDQKTGKAFYFNQITGERTQQRPSVMGPAIDTALIADTPNSPAPGGLSCSGDGGDSPSPSPGSHRHGHGRARTHSSSREGGSPMAKARDRSASSDGDGFHEVDPAKVKEMQFRKKRFRLLQAIHKDKKERAGLMSPVTRPVPGAQRPSASGGGGGASATMLKNAMELTVRREKLLTDGYYQLMGASMDGLMKRTRVTFKGEEGIDSGGPSKEFFLLLSDKAGRYGMLKRTFLRLADGGGIFLNGPLPPGPAGSTAGQPGKVHGIGGEGTDNNKPDPDMDLNISIFDFAAFLGRLLGKTVFERQLVDLPLSFALLDAMLGHQDPPAVLEERKIAEKNKSKGKGGSSVPNTKTNGANKVDVKGGDAQTPEEKVHKPGVSSAGNGMSAKTAHELHRLAQLDEQLHKSLKWTLDTDNVHDMVEQTFSVTSLIYMPGGGPPKPKEVPLCKDGTSRMVTDENKDEFVRLRAEWETRYSMEKTLRPFMDAFHELVPLDALRDSGLSCEELQAMLNGKEEIDVEEVRAYTMFQGNLSHEHVQVVWLWDILRGFDMNQRQAFLRFVTGTTRVPLDGYDPPFNLTEGVDMTEGSLPRAHTCFNQLVIPQYKNAAQMREKVLFAIENTDGFAMT